MELNVPLFLHPAPAGIDGPPAFPALNCFDLELLIGFANQETIAVATMIFGGVIDRHPNLDICISHGGGAIPFLAGRFAEAARTRPWSVGAMREPDAFLTRLKRFWFDNHVHDPLLALALLTERVGAGQLVLGTNFAGWDQPKTLASHDAPAYLANNARRLLRQSNDQSRSK